MNNTLHKGLKLLEIMARSPGPIGITEMARRTSLGKSDVHRLMQSLVELGFARRESSHGSYAASTKVWELGVALIANHDVRRTALPQMQRLADTARETVCLGVLDGLDVVWLDALDGPESMRGHIEGGSRAPVHATATGKAILSTFGETALDALPLSLERLTDETVTDAGRLLRDVHQAREIGYAVDRGEHRPQIWSVAAPIVGANRVAAIGICAPADRMDPARLQSLGAMVSDTARLIGVELARSTASPAPARRRVGRELANGAMAPAAAWSSTLPARERAPYTAPAVLESIDR